MTEAPRVLQKPPGYKDPNALAQPLPKPPQRRPIPTYPEKRRRSCCQACCCCFCIFILILILLIFISGAIFYLLFDPKLPVFHFKSFEVPHFDVAITSHGTFLDAKTVAHVEVKNPNQKLGLYYGNTHVTPIIGGGEAKEVMELGSATVPGFSQDKKKVTNLKVESEGKKVKVSEGAGPRLRSAFKKGGLTVKVNVRTRVGVKVGDFKVGMVTVNVKCGGASLKDLQVQAGGAAKTKCSLQILKWYN